MPQHGRFDPPHRLSLGDARVRDAIHVTIQQRLLVFGSELPVMRHLFVMIVRDEIEDVLLEIRAGATDRMDLVAADHLRERHPDLGGRHRAGDGHKHFPAAIEMADVVVGCSAEC